MKQVAQSLSGGRPRVLQVPEPALRPGGVLVTTRWSLISAGTERMIVDLAGKSLAGKARSRPDHVRKVLAKVRTDGLAATVNAVRARLKGDLPLGYSASGVVAAVGRGVEDLAVGQEVACAGAGHANHAEVVFVPRNLVVPVPRGLSLREAATVTLGAVALQGVRRTEPVLGERIAVIGLGMLGLLTVQLLRSAGCHVFAFDLDPAKARLAKSLGAEVAMSPEDGDAEAAARSASGGHGLDAAVVTAASSTSEPAVLAGRLCRLGGRVTIVGAVGLDLPRGLYYDRELDLRVARSYGPGRYDPDYEEKGIDYPYAYVRFTEGRNMEEYLSLLARGDVEVDPLLTGEFGIEEGERAYDFLMGEEGTDAIGLLFSYPEEPSPARPAAERGRVDLRRRDPAEGGVGVGLVGAGAFARSVLLPALGRLPAFRPTGVVTATGLTAVATARDAGFAFATTDLDELLRDGETKAVLIATRHADHAGMAVAALEAGKDVFLEKPLAMSPRELDELSEAVAGSGRLLQAGFNRRFAPHVELLRRRFAGRAGPIHMLYRVNAGPIPAEHWTRDLAQGGGRIVGEVCHFVDLLLHLAGRPPVLVTAEGLPEEGVSATIRFADGSVGTIVYAVSGDPVVGKERLEVFGDGRSGIVDNFRVATVASGGRRTKLRGAGGKGHREQMRAFLEAVRTGGPSPVPYSQAAWSTRATFGILDSLAGGGAVELG
ncbi:MAG: bi-domain-containing oxidoreductase [Planctomycetota bacterium]